MLGVSGALRALAGIAASIAASLGGRSEGGLDAGPESRRGLGGGARLRDVGRTESPGVPSATWITGTSSAIARTGATFIGPRSTDALIAAPDNNNSAGRYGVAPTSGAERV